MKKHNIFFTLLLLCALVSSSIAQDNEINIPLTTPGNQGQLQVEIHSGPVTVKGTNRTDVLLRYEEKKDKQKYKKGKKNSGLKRISGGGLSLEISEKDNEVIIESSNHHKMVRLYIEVPTNFDLDINTHHNGEVNISDIKGEVVVESHHGGITATNINGSVVANTWHGAIIVSFSGITPDTPLAFSTYHGEIDISLPTNTKADLKMQSEAGEIFSSFDVDLKKLTKTQKREENGMFRIKMDNWI
ncbi:MAG: DUF4097 family beta strand repeat-containing protein, partial [Bacteroidota bacterium]